MKKSRRLTALALVLIIGIVGALTGCSISIESGEFDEDGFLIDFTLNGIICEFETDAMECYQIGFLDEEYTVQAVPDIEGTTYTWYRQERELGDDDSEFEDLEKSKVSTESSYTFTMPNVNDVILTCVVDSGGSSQEYLVCISLTNRDVDAIPDEALSEELPSHIDSAIPLIEVGEQTEERDSIECSSDEIVKLWVMAALKSEDENESDEIEYHWYRVKDGRRESVGHNVMMDNMNVVRTEPTEEYVCIIRTTEVENEYYAIHFTLTSSEE